MNGLKLHSCSGYLKPSTQNKAYMTLSKMGQAGNCLSLFTATSLVSSQAVILSAFTCIASVVSFGSHP